jgi:hypothetical protein
VNMIFTAWTALKIFYTLLDFRFSRQWLWRFLSNFWDIMPSSPVKINWRFGRTSCIYLQGQRVSHSRNRHEGDLLFDLHLDPEDGG